MSFCNLRPGVRVDSRTRVHISSHRLLRTDRAAATSGAVVVADGQKKTFARDCPLSGIWHAVCDVCSVYKKASERTAHD
jgi:hypothetical protein